MKQFFVLLLAFTLILPATSFAVTKEDLMEKIQDLNRQLEELKKQMDELKQQEQLQDARVSAVEERAEEAVGKWSWLQISGDYRFRLDSLKGKVHDYHQYDPFSLYGPLPTPYGFDMYTFTKPVEGHTVKNDTVMFNRFRLKLKAQVTENIQFKTRLSMYKTWGHETMLPVQGNFFADRAFGPFFDGTMGHVPMDNVLRVDYAYATWSNIFGYPVWFSIGRRASTEGIPTTVRQNTIKESTAGVAGLLIDWAFDGLTVGVAPYIEALPGFYAKLCYGRGYDSGLRTDVAGLVTPKDTDFLGIFIDPIFTDNLNVEFNWVRAFNLFDAPPDNWPMKIDTGVMMGGPPSGTFITVDAPVTGNVGDLDIFGANVIGKLEDIGPGDLNLFISGAISRSHPNTNLRSMPFAWMDMNGNGAVDDGEIMNAGFGLLYDDDPNTPEVDKKSHTGKAIYLGARYDFTKTGTKIGVEYNYGSKYWLTFTPAADDMWTSKLGTRGHVYEAYLIQELPEIPVAKFGKAFIRVGYQYYKFKYTGSNFWLGEPKKIEDLNTMDPMTAQYFTPLESAHDIYLTFDVTF